MNYKKLLLIISFAVQSLLFITAVAIAEIVVLKSGTTLEGRLQRLSDEEVTILKPDGTSQTFSLSHVRSILTDDQQLIWGALARTEDSVVVKERARPLTEDHPYDSLKAKHKPRAANHGFVGLKVAANRSGLKFVPSIPNASHVTNIGWGLVFMGPGSTVRGRVDLYHVTHGATNDDYIFIENRRIDYSEEIKASYFGVSPVLMFFLNQEKGNPFVEVGFNYEAKLKENYSISTEDASAEITPELKENSGFVFGFGILITTKGDHRVMWNIRYSMGNRNIAPEDASGSIKTSDLSFAWGLLF